MGEKPALLQLNVIEGPVAGTKLQKDGRFFIIGRTKKANFQIKDPSVSEKHAELSWTSNNRWEIRDTDSSNGTKVNAISINDGNWVPLNDGDEIRFGDSSLVKVEIVALPVDDDLTVEQFLEAEVHQLEQKIRNKAEQLISSLREDWQGLKKDLLQAK